MRDLPFTRHALHDAYADGADPGDVMAEALRRAAAAEDPGIFLHLADEASLREAAAALGRFDPSKPLWGLPFAVKDNIDVAGMPTTAACPTFAYLPESDAFAVARLREAGAIPIGKTNLDQFATGLVGVRTPLSGPAQRAGPSDRAGGLLLRLCGGDGAGDCGLRAGDRHGGVGARAGGAEQHRGAEAEPRGAVGHGRGPGLPDAGHHLDLRADRGGCLGRLPRGGGLRRRRRLRAAPRRCRPSAPRRRRSGRAFPTRAPAASSATRCRRRRSTRLSTRCARWGREVVEIDFQPFHDVAAMLYDGAWVAERHAALEDILRDAPDARASRDPRHRGEGRGAVGGGRLPRLLPATGAEAGGCAADRVGRSAGRALDPHLLHGGGPGGGSGGAELQRSGPTRTS